MSWYCVMTSSAHNKGTAAKFSQYRNVAVVEVQDGMPKPRMISPRAIGLIRIVQFWPSCNVGTSERCQYQIALREAEALVDELNATQSLRTLWTTPEALSKNA